MSLILLYIIEITSFNHIRNYTNNNIRSYNKKYNNK